MVAVAAAPVAAVVATAAAASKVDGVVLAEAACSVDLPWAVGGMVVLEKAGEF